MIIKKVFALITFSIFLMMSVSCSSAEENIDTSSQEEFQMSETESPETEKTEEAAPESTEKPVLSLSEKEISYSNLDHENGTVITIDYSVSGITNGWSSSGIHIAYDDRLTVEANEVTKEPSFERGEASESLSSVLVVFWKGEEPPEELKEQNMNNISVITSDSRDSGYNGIIASVDCRIPADAQVGDVYEIKFFRYETDCFLNSANDKVMQEYAFENWKNGYIKITD